MTVRRQKPDLRAGASMAARTFGCQWTARLSRTTTSPAHADGTNTRFGVGAQISALSIGPSKTVDAVTLRHRFHAGC
jgi:hypothetical protein